MEIKDENLKLVFQKVIGKVICTTRESQNISQGYLGELIGIDSTYISRIELGDIMPSVFTFSRIASGLGISAGELLNKIEKEMI